MKSKTISKPSMTLLPPAPHVCQVCARDHGPHEAHDGLSLFYGTRFMLVYGRSPTWADAVHHLPKDIRSLWRTALEEQNAWTEPDDCPIAETPYAKEEANATISPALDGRYPPYLKRNEGAGDRSSD